MIKNKLLFALLLLCIIFIPRNVYAASSAEKYICGKGNMNQLKNKINNVKITYDLVEDKEYGSYYVIKIADFSDGIAIRIPGRNDITYDKFGKNFDLPKRYDYQGGNVSIEFYGHGDHPCAEHYISKKIVKLPKYNSFSELDDCIEFEEFPLCARYYDGNIPDTEYFYKKLDEYKKDVASREVKIKDPGIIENVKEFVEDNQLLVASLALVFIILTIYLVVRAIIRRVKRTKVKF